MNEELQERYIYAVVRRLPRKQREDIEQELRGLIADMLEARCRGGGGRVLQELGQQPLEGGQVPLPSGLGRGLEAAAALQQGHQGLGVRGLGQALHRRPVPEEPGRLGAVEDVAAGMICHGEIPPSIL